MEGTAKIKTDELAAASRPFTTMGSATLHLDTTQSRDRAQASRKPSTAGAVSTGRLQATEGEFDVRKFILDQKGTEPLHQSSLFRSASFLEQQQPHLKSRSSAQPNHSTSDLTKRSKKLLPKMDMGSSHSFGTLPVSSDDTKKAQSASVNQQHDDEYVTVSHFYTIEKMAESCCHAAQSRNKTWHFLPGSEERSKGNNSSGGVGGSSITGVERPSRRVDVLDLEKCFETAIQFANKKNKWDVACNEKMAMIDRDFMSIEARVAQKYSSSSPSSGELLPAAGGVEKSTGDQKVLVKLFFEQKWSDVVLGELEAMLTVSFLEQGVLLRKARIQYAQAFYQLEHLYCSRSRELKQALQESEKMRQETFRASENHQRDTDDMKEQYGAEIRRLNVGFEARKEEMEKKVTESKEQVTKMGDTMKTLNTIFRQMREDTEKVKAVELRENYNKLEKKYELCREEVERLRPLILENQALAAAKEAVEQELETLKNNVSNMSVILAVKDDTIANLMEQQSDMIAAQELQAAQEEERRKRAQDEADDEEDDLRESNSPASSNHETDGSSAGPNVPRLRPNSVGVCVRCKQDMKDMSVQGRLVDQPPDSSLHGGGNSKADSFEASGSDNRKVQEVRKRRIQCLYFRILLPNLRGRRPHKEMAWTLSCMRSIVFAKQIDDTMCKRNGGIFSLRIRMPEFVYSWFSPWRSIRDEKNQDDLDAAYVEPSDKSDSSAPLPRSILSSEQQQMQADEDRWCLYYGVKALVQEGYLEAKLFLSLLDEKYGEDELVFMLYCYRVLNILIGGRLNWGPLRDCTSYVKFAEQYEMLGPAATNGPSTKRVPKTIWISPYHASLATGVVLSKATESERSALDKKIMNYVVNNVPEEEKPIVFLPPDQPRHAKKKKHGKKPQSAADPSKAHDDEDDDEDAAPIQFVDANLWVELMMLEYKEEQAHRRAAIRLMFQTATGAMTSVVGPAGAESRQPLITLGGISAATMDMEQFRIMIRTLNDEIPSFMVANLFRNAYVKGNGAVNFDAFMDVAESAQFFSSCMRLESPAAGIARLPDSQYLPTSAALSTSSRATHMVEKFFAILRGELTSSIEALPLWTRSMADYLSYEISSCLEDSEDAFSDGVRLLTSFYRLVDNLLLTKLIKHEITGCLLHSKNIFRMEKALNALLECVRLRDKSSVEILIDTVKQKLCVKRMQTAFREHLMRDQGAPLVMRPLLHHHYGKKECDYHARVAERPLSWLLYVISAVLRQSMRPERYSVLLTELSMTSSAFHGTSSYTTSSSSTMNGGIGPAPKPVLMELIYDFFLGKVGTRWEAEKLIHDVFVNCRAYVKTNGMVMIFTALCSMSNAAPDDRLLGQNEALAFLHGIFRCGLHSFRIINPPSLIYSVASDTGKVESEASATIEPPDWIPIKTAESILLGAFSKLSTDQKQRLQVRVEEAAKERPDTKDGAEIVLRSSSTTNLKTQQPSGTIEAGAFLLLALTEWKRYIVQRMNEVKMVCCTLEDEMLHFESFAQIDAIANVLEKADASYLKEDLCIIFRRFCSTEKRHAEKKATASGSSHKLPPSPTEDHISDRLAAACFPVLAREPLTELQRLENNADEPFKIAPNPLQSYEFLVSSWGGYREQCKQLLEELRRIGKSNDIQTESFSRRASAVSSGNRGSMREVLYLSSSTSADRLSSQDVAQHEAVYLLFIERLERLEDLFEKDRTQRHGRSSSKRGSISVSGDGLLSLVDDMHSATVMVNETWKIFRQVLLGFIRLRALASLGKGTLPDEWSQVK